jgi:hypothetical protein
MIDDNIVEGLICLSTSLRNVVYGVSLTTMVMAQQMLKKVHVQDLGHRQTLEARRWVELHN